MKFIVLLSFLLTFTLCSGCRNKDTSGPDNRMTTSTSPSPSGSPSPSLTNSDGVNQNPTGVKEPQPPIPFTPATPSPTPCLSRACRKIIMCSCYDYETRRLLWKRRLSVADCKSLCPIEFSPKP